MNIDKKNRRDIASTPIKLSTFINSTVGGLNAKGKMGMPEKSDGAWYIISIAAEKAEVHEQTLRHYERLGLISPARKGPSPHSPRLYSDRDIERVIHIRRLMRDLGVNLAGVEAILHMKDRMEQLQEELEEQMRQMQSQHEAEMRRLKEIIERLQRGSSSPQE